MSFHKRIGCHVSKQETLIQTIQANGLLTCQMYWGQNAGWDVTIWNQSDLNLTRDYCLANDLTFYVHASCAIHLGKPIEYHGKLVSYLNKITYQLKDLPAGLVVHIAKGEKSSLDYIDYLIKQIYLPPGTGRVQRKFILENAAGQKNEKGSTWEELYQLIHPADPKVGLCLDTQHAFAAGLFDSRKPGEIDFFLNYCDQHFPDRLQLIHLNDSGVNYGAHVDRHGGTRIGQGYIWSSDLGAGDAGLKRLLHLAGERGLDMILETGGGIEDVSYLHNNYSQLD